MTRTPQPQASSATRAGVRHTVRVGALPWRRLLHCKAAFDALTPAGAAVFKLALPLVSPARALLAYTEARRHD